MRTQLGVGLVEVMVALVVLALGLLGMMSMQLTALQQSNQAYQRTQATLLANEMLDRIRANPDALSKYFSATGTTNNNCLSWHSAASGCSANQLAGDDIASWQTSLQQKLPGGKGRVCRSDQTDDAPGVPDCEAANANLPVVVYIWWQNGQSGSTEMLTLAAGMTSG